MAKSLTSQMGIQDGQQAYFRGGHPKWPKTLLQRWAFKINIKLTSVVGIQDGWPKGFLLTQRWAIKMAKSLNSQVSIQDGQKPYFRGGHSRLPKGLLQRWAFKMAKRLSSDPEVGNQDGQRHYFKVGLSRWSKALLHRRTFIIAKRLTLEVGIQDGH